ncbi:MAG: cobyrinic acid a,c-diamide synthase [Rhodospirillales bacterium]
MNAAADAGLPPAAPGLIVAAPASGSGKTVFTLGLIRHWARSGVRVASAKVGPDYIDPAFHGAASGRPCLNLDPWAMRAETLAAAAVRLQQAGEVIVCEGVMGLFDGATVDSGSTADLAAASGWPVLLVVDAGAGGERRRRCPRLRHPPAGPRHRRRRLQPRRQRAACVLLREALRGDLAADPGAGVPAADGGAGAAGAASRPGAGDRASRPASFLDRAADLVAAHVDTGRLRGLAQPGWRGGAAFASLAAGTAAGPADRARRRRRLRLPLSAGDRGWRVAGPRSGRSRRSPTKPAGRCGRRRLSAGRWSELHAGRLAGNRRFLDGLRRAAECATVFGECGGYMVMGEGLIDADGVRHAMAGLLPLETSFAGRRLHLGYRRAELCSDGPLGPAGSSFRGHEFHFALTLREGPGAPLFRCVDAAGQALGTTGLASGRTIGSFIHLIDRA